MGLALNVTFVGLTVVFLALIALCLVIYLFSKAFAVQKTVYAKNSQDVGGDKVCLEAEDNTVSSSNENFSSDEELIAVLTAAVQASMGYRSESNIIVKSFRRIPQNSPVWNFNSRMEQLAAKL